MGRGADPARGHWSLSTYGSAFPYGVLLPDATALRETADALAIAEQSGDDFSLDLGRSPGRGLTRQDGPQREAGFELLASTRDEIMDERFAWEACRSSIPILAPRRPDSAISTTPSRWRGPSSTIVRVGSLTLCRPPRCWWRHC